MNRPPYVPTPTTYTKPPTAVMQEQSIYSHPWHVTCQSHTEREEMGQNESEGETHLGHDGMQAAG